MYGAPLALHVLTHSFPTRRSSDLDAVADMPEHHAAQRPRDEADRRGRESGDDAVEVVAGLGKEELAEHQRRGCAIEEEFIPFDDRARHRGAHDLLQIGQVGLLLMLHMSRSRMSFPEPLWNGRAGI